MSKLSPKNVRTRLTLWYVGVLTIILLVFMGVSVSLIYYRLRNDLDHLLENDYETIENLIEIEPDGKVVVDSDEERNIQELWFELWSSDWEILYRNKPFSMGSTPPLDKDEDAFEGFNYNTLTLENDVVIRVLTGKINIEGKWFYIRLLRYEDGIRQEVGHFIRLLIYALPIALLIAGFGGYFLAGKFLEPLDKMTRKASGIGGSNLKERLPVVNPNDELGKLAITINDLLERIQISFDRLKQFTSDAAHELRTPLTAIRSIGEVGLKEKSDSAEYRDIIGSILEENNRLVHLVDSLLFLSRSDSDTIEVKLTEFKLSEFIERTAEFINPLAEEKNQKISVSGDDELKVKIDGILMREALLNIIDNAVKYSPEKSTIKIEFSEKEGVIEIRVIDNGPGIKEEDTERIFERFYRVDKGRSRELGGSGLGLAIARRSVMLQGGNIEVESKFGYGSVFKIKIKNIK